MIFGSSQVPLVQFNDINLGKWQKLTKIEKPHVYSWVMNNYWFTNFRASQEGEFKWSYYLTSTKGNSNIDAVHFATNSNTPLVPRVLPPGKEEKKATNASTLKLDAHNVVLISARPSYYDNSIILHLREVEGKSVTLNLSEQMKNVKSIDEVNYQLEVDIWKRAGLGGAAVLLMGATVKGGNLGDIQKKINRIIN